jgi:hypothetical protein
MGPSGTNIGAGEGWEKLPDCQTLPELKNKDLPQISLMDADKNSRNFTSKYTKERKKRTQKKSR